MDIYTPIEEAGEIIRKRWANKNLREAVEKKLHGDIPEILKNGPQGVLGRCVCTPDMEFERFLELCNKAVLKPVGFEYVKDKFYHGNFTKYALTNLPFSSGLDKNLKNIVRREKIIDFEYAKGKTLRMCDLKTLWGENLVDFHHFFLQKMFSVMKDRVIDTSDWFPKTANRTESYYNLVLLLSLCHIVLFDDFDLLKEEDEFTNKIVIPIMGKVENDFGFKPIIVKISKVGEHDKDPFWWCYSEKAKRVMDNHIKSLKC
jgi:hypothetical protein